jgi:L-alanine-DL-glutamate epimerase-like enolase superfamily enzyme
VKISSIRASVHQIEVTIPLLQKPIERRKVVFCSVETEDGLVGFGLTGHFLPFAVAVALEKEFFPVVKGMDVRETEAIHSKIWWTLNPRSMTGVVSSALSCLDIALWDIQGKAAGRSVAQLLGGARDSAPTYITFGFPQYDRDQLVEAARLQVAAGNRRLKLVVAAVDGGWQEDAERIRLVREAVGDGVELMIDANYLFSPVEARYLARAVEEYRLSWFEEPLHQNDARALADLRAKTNIPLAAGQMEGHRWRLRELIDLQAVDIVQPNCVYNGGYTETRKVAHLAQAYNLPMANGGGWPLFNMHTMAGLMNGWLVEFHLGMQMVGELLFVDPPRPLQQRVEIPAAPGLGLKLNADALKETKVSG